MVRQKQNFSDIVQLYLTGPKSIISEPVIVHAKLSHTWFEFLLGELGLEVAPERGIFVCSLNYTTSAPRKGRGWRSELNEEIRHFISKFERKRPTFSVRLCHPRKISVHSTKAPPNQPASSDPRDVSGKYEKINYQNSNPSSSSQGNQQTYGTCSKRLLQRPVLANTTSSAGPSNGQASAKPAKQRRLRSPKKPGKEKQQRRDPTTTRATESITMHESQFRIRNVSSAPESIKIEPVPPSVVVQPDWDDDEFWDDDSDESSEQQRQQNGIGNGSNGNDKCFSDEGNDEDDCDNASLLTAATAEENELRSQGITVEDVKSLAEGRISRFSNAYMLRVRDEIQKLQQNHLWDRNVNRSPLACYFLQEIFKQ